MKKINILFLILVLVAPLIIFFGCGQQIETLSFREDSTTIFIDETYELNVVVQPDIEGVDITYSVSDESIIRLLPNQKRILGVKAGQAKVYARTEGGLVAEMAVTVLSEKITLATPSGLTFNPLSQTLSWFPVSNAYNYEVLIWQGENVQKYETFYNNLSFQSINLEYKENLKYDFTVTAKPSSTSEIYINSSQSEKYSFKQIKSVSELQYNDEKITFQYNLAGIDLADRKNIEFQLGIFKNNISVSSQSFTEKDLVDGKISFNYLPTEVGEYFVEVVVACDGLTNSIKKELVIEKLSAPSVTTDGKDVFVSKKGDYLYKYFKTQNSSREEVTAQDLFVSNIESGEEIVYEAFAYKGDSGNRYYINSETTKLIVQKLVTPSGVKLEKIDDKTGVKIVWDKDYENNDYTIYINGERAEKKTRGGSDTTLIATVEDYFIDAGIYEVTLQASKAAQGNVYYIPSESSAAVKVIKLAASTLEYDNSSKEFIITSQETSFGGKINLAANYNNSTFKMLNEEITSGEMRKTLVGLNINIQGVCETVSFISKESLSEGLVYLDSEEYSFNINKLNQPTIFHSYEDGKLSLYWDKINKATSYIVEIKNVTNNLTLIYKGGISEKDGQIFIEIDDLENGIDYEISITAIPMNSTAIELGIKTQYLSSNVSIKAISRLATPNVQIESKGVKEVTCVWSEVSGAERYEIFVNGISRGETLELTYKLEDISEGTHSFSVVAKSSESGKIPSSINQGINKINYIQMAKIENISYKIISETQSEVNFKKIEGATSYILRITLPNGEFSELTSYSTRKDQGKDIIYFRFDKASYFNDAGVYNLHIRAFSSDIAIIENNLAEKALEKLEKVASISTDADNSVIIWTKGVGPLPSDYEVRINGVAVTDYNFEDGLVYSILGLEPGIYDISIVAKGDNISTIDSSVFSEQIYKQENLSSPTIDSFGASSGSDTNLELVFKEIEGASYYEVYVVDVELNILYSSTQVTHTGLGTISYIIDRSEFVAEQNQYLYIKAFSGMPTYANSVTPDLSQSENVVKIYKLGEVKELVVEDGKLKLGGLQAFINYNYYLNTDFVIPSLSSEELFEFLVRDYGSYGDQIFNGTFYMAGDWVEFIIEKLQTPTIMEYEDKISWENDSYEEVGEYLIKIDFYGLGGEVVKTKTFYINKNTRELSYEQIISIILGEEQSRLDRFVGAYTMFVQGIAVEQSDQKIYLNSNSQHVNFSIKWQLNNELISQDMDNLGVIELSFDEVIEDYVYLIELHIEQGGKTAITNLFLSGMPSPVSGDSNMLNSVHYEIFREGGRVIMHINVKEAFEPGACLVKWKAIGQEGGFTLPSSDFSELNCDKLTTPLLNYEGDIHGNYIVVESSVLLQYDEHVTIYAEYNGEILAFDNGRLLLPYSWEDVEEINVFALSDAENTIISDRVNVEITLEDIVENLRFENDENPESPNFDRNFLLWDAGGEETSWIIYIYYENSLIYNEIVGVRKIDLTDIVQEAGDYTFKISACGDGIANFNSNLAEITAIKLGNENISLSNTNGELHWNIPTEMKNKIIRYRLVIGGDNKISFDKNILSDALIGKTGAMQIRIRVIGDVSQNILSSEYTEAISFYKFNTPTTFKILGGEFAFGDEGDLYVKDEYFRIVINSSTYSYRNNSSVPSILNFYAQDVYSGEAYSYIAGGNSIYISNKQVLTLNSDQSSLVFNRLQVDLHGGERYLTQLINDGNVTTYFNWIWTETGNVSDRMVAIYLKPEMLVTGSAFGWERVLKGNNYVEYYKLTVSANVSYNEETNETTFTVIQSLPNLPTATSGSSVYKILVQKVDSEQSLSSKTHQVITFEQLSKPNMYISGGRLIWTDFSNAENFLLKYYDIDTLSSGHLDVGKVVNYELGAEFADSSFAKSYNFIAIAMGNVTTSKPEQMPDSNFVYKVSSAASSSIDIVKPRTAGDLKLINGGLEWDEEYSTYASTSKLEFIFSNSSSSRSVEVSPNAFARTYPNINEIINDLFSSYEAVLNIGGTFTIKYRELGSNSFANSEYKVLENNIVIPGNPDASKQFKIAPTVNNLSISDAGLSWSPVTIPVGELSPVRYNIYFRLNTDGYVHAKTQTETILTIEDMRDLTVFKANADNITGVFVTVSGDNEKYIAGFKSQTLSVNTIAGDMGIFIEEGVIKWQSFENAARYEVKTKINLDDVVYKIYKVGNNYYLDKEVNGVIVSQGVQLQTLTVEEGGIWAWNWAEDENIDAGNEYGLSIRYIPQRESWSTYAIPGKYSGQINVYKLSEAQPEIVEGQLSWIPVNNAQKYIVHIKYLKDIGGELVELSVEQIETELTKISLIIRNEGQTNIQVAVQSIGPTGSHYGKYYINALKIFKDVEVKENLTKNFTLNGDVLSWEDEESGNKYEIIVRYSRDGQNQQVSHITTSKQVDLSKLNLDSGFTYSVYLKVIGNSGTLETGSLSSVILDASIEFKVFPQVGAIEMKQGEAIWEIESVQHNYRVEISTTDSKTYIYTIEYRNGEYSITNLTLNGNIVTNNSTLDEFSEDGKTYLKFWAAEFGTTNDATLKISIIGASVGGVYHISSTEVGLSNVLKAGTPTGINIEIQGNSIKFGWTRDSRYRYNIIIEDGEGNIVLDEQGLNARSYTFQEMDLLEEGQIYIFKIQSYHSTETRFKSNFATLEFSISSEGDLEE